jgi:hypothetical protein
VSKIIAFPVVMQFEDSVCHGGKSYPTLEALEASITALDRARIDWWGERFGRPRTPKKGGRRVPSGGGCSGGSAA